MTDPKNSEAQSEELDLEQLKDAAGGLEGTEGNDRVQPRHKRTLLNVGSTSGPGGTTYPKTNISGSAGPGGTTYLKENIGGSASPGGDDV